MKAGGKLLSVFVVLFLVALTRDYTFAVPAYPGKVTVKDIYGNTVDIHMRGDEYCKYAVTTDNYSIIGDSSGWWYLTQKNDGTVDKSSFRLVADSYESKELIEFKDKCPKNLIPSNNNIIVKRAQDARQEKAMMAPVIGERRALVVLMEFRDREFSKTNDDFYRLFNEIGYNQNNALGSVRDYYRYASQNQLDFLIDVFGPYKSIHNMSYYGGNVYHGGDDVHALELCIEAMKSLPKGIDFSIYDNNNDGLIDNVHIIYAGYGEEAGASTDAIWAHEYSYRIPLKSEIGYSLAGYSCSPELRGNIGSSITNIGVICHELGHTLGAMDYYDTNYKTGGSYVGTGEWDIMGEGSWNDNGRCPPNFNPYVRSEIFGWNSQTALSADQHIVIPGRESDNVDMSTIYRIDTGSEGDYFLLENRQKYGFDSALPGYGLMIYHIHPELSRYRITNTINSSHPQCLYPVCASGSEPGLKRYGNINSSECPFPGSKNVKSFTPTTNPAAVAWDGSSIGLSLTGITTNPSDGTVSFFTVGGDGATHEPDDNPTEKIEIYSESFEQGLSDDMNIVSTIGKYEWRVYKKGGITVDPDLIPEPEDGKKILMLYSGKDNSICEGEFMGPAIDIESGAKYNLSFSVASKTISTSINPTLRVYLADEYGEYELYTLNNKSFEQWTQINIPIVSAGNYIRLKFFGSINSGGIFIDNITLYSEEIQTLVDKQLQLDYQEEADVYTIDGTKIELHDVESDDLQRGIYIIRQGKKRKKFFIVR